MRMREHAMQAIAIFAILLAVVMLNSLLDAAFATSSTSTTPTASYTYQAANSVQQNATITFNVLPSNQGISFNGVLYYQSNSISIAIGNYPINALPVGNFIFSKWQVSNSNASIANTTAANTIVAISGNAIITANFNALTTFYESGLPSNTAWNVTFNGNTNNAISPNSIFFITAPGQYSFQVANQVVGSNTFVPYPANGLVYAGNSITINFSILTTSTTSTASKIASNTILNNTNLIIEGLPYGIGLNLTLLSGGYIINGTKATTNYNIHFITKNGDTVITLPSNIKPVSGNYILFNKASLIKDVDLSGKVWTYNKTTTSPAVISGKLVYGQNNILAFYSPFNLISFYLNETKQLEAMGVSTNSSIITSLNNLLANSTINLNISNILSANQIINIISTNTLGTSRISNTGLHTNLIVHNVHGYIRLSRNIFGTSLQTSLIAYRNITKDIPYGHIKLSGNYLSANKAVSFPVFNSSQRTLYIIKATVIKASPQLCVDTNLGDVCTTTNQTTPVPLGVPVINGHFGLTQNNWYPLNVSFKSSLLANNTASWNVTIKDLSNGTVLFNQIINSKNINITKNYKIPVTQQVEMVIKTSGNSNYTSLIEDPVTAPTNIQAYIPITLSYNGLATYPNPFQQIITVNALNYTSYIAYNNNFANFEYFYANGTIIPAWIESNSSNIITTWVKLSNTIFPNTGSSSATNTIYLGFASKTTNLLSSSGTTGIGEAPQLSSTYAQYDDGASVFSLYFNGNTPLSDFNFEGNTGTQASVTGPTGTKINVISITGYASNFGFVYTAKSLTNQPIIAESSSQQAGNQAGGTGADNGQVSIVSGTSTSGLDAISVDMGWASSYFTNDYYSGGSQTTDVNQQGTANTNWHYASVTYFGSSASSWSGYIAPQLYSTSGGYSGTVSNNPLSSSSTLYLGLIGSVDSSYSWQTYINWMRARAYPPNGVMPSVSFTSVQTAPGYPLLTITSNSITYGGTSTITASGNPNTDTIELFMNGNLIGGPSTGTITYVFNSLQYGAGSYTFNAFDENSLKSNIGTLIVNKATPIISLPHFPQPFIYNGSSATITASLSSYNNQLAGNIYINNTFLKSFTTSTSFTETNPNNYTVVANTIGNANYTAASVSNTLIICPQVSPLPSNIVAYSCIILNNNQKTATPNPFQQIVNVSEANFSNYIAYNNNFANFEFFYQNGTIIPAWIESNSSGTLHVWLKIKGIPASKHILVYLGFASKTTNLLSSSGTTGIGEAPQLSSTYAQYDDGASVFSLYFNGNTPLSDFNFEGNTGTQASVTGPTGTKINVISITGYASNFGFVYTAKSLTNQPIIAESSSQQAGNQAGGTGADNGQVSIVSGTSTSGLNAISVDMGWASSYFTNDYFSNGAQTTDVNQQGTANTNWHYASVTYFGSSASSWSGYIAPQLYSTSGGYSGTVSNNPLSSSSTLYLGLIGSVDSSYYWQTYINWMRARAYPPNGVMPSVSFSSVQTAPGYPLLTITPNSITYGGTSNITASVNPNTDTIELFMNGNLIGGPSTGTIKYTFNSLQYGAGSYTFNAFDENSLKSNIGTLIVNKAAPIISLPNFPQPFIYNGSSATITASLSSYNNQLAGNIYINNTFLKSFTTSTSFTETNPNNYTVVANTIGNANYTAVSVSNTLIICPQVSPLPSNIVAYSCMILNNSQTTATPNPFQQIVNISEANFSDYIAYNNNFANFEFFYQNGTIIPAWIESNSSGTLHVWLKIKGIPASKHILAYLGFASNTINLLSSSGTSGIGEAPQLSSTYGEYDDGASVFTQYGGKSWSSFTFLGGTWTTANGYLQQTATSTSGYTGGGPAALIESTSYPNNGYYILGMAFNYTTEADARVGIIAVATPTTTPDVMGYRFIGQQDSNGAGFISFLNDLIAWVVNNAYQGAVSTAYTMIVTNAGGTWSGNLYSGYGTEISSPLTSLSATAYTNANYEGATSGYVGISAAYYTGSQTIPNPINVMWFYMRAYPPNGVMPSVSFTKTLHVNICTITLGTSAINFGTINAGSNIATSNAITDTNSGNANAYMFVYGGNWIGPAQFGVSNTTWSAAANTPYSIATRLSSAPSNTFILVPSGSSNSIYFGLGVPRGAPSGAYSQTITIENSC